VYKSFNIISDKSLISLKTVKGQIKGIVRMMEDDISRCKIFSKRRAK